MRNLLTALVVASFLPAQAQPALLRDVMPGTMSSSPNGFITNGRTVLFGATDPLGQSLWTSDGTPIGTQHLIVESSRNVRALGSGFAILDGTDVRYVDVSGTVRAVLRALHPIDAEHTAVVGARLFFTADDGVSGTELWSTDGTIAGTRVLDLGPLSQDSFPRVIGRIGGHCAFLARRSFGGFEFFTSDGTLGGTRSWPGMNTATPDATLAIGDGIFFVVAEQTIFFAHTNGNSLQVAVPASQNAPTPFGVVGSKLVFTQYDVATGTEPWVTDGTPAGTMLLADVMPGPAGGSAILPTTSGGRVLFFAAGGVWVTDATPTGTVLALPTTNVTIADRSPWLERANGRVLLTTTIGTRSVWEVDTVAATARDLGVELFLSTAAEGRVFGKRFDAVHGNEPWVWSPGAMAIRVGTPCGAGVDAADLRAGEPRLGATLRFSGTVPNAATTGLLVVGAPSRTAIPIGNGCVSYLELNNLVTLAPITGASNWTLSIPLPVLPALVGVTFAAQAWFGPSTLPLAIESSNGVHLTFG